MKIGIIGYGQMGKMIEQTALQRKHEIVSIVDVNRGEITSEADCYIDFSVASAIPKTIKEACRKNVPLVIGTTAWKEQKNWVEKYLIDKNNKAIWASNFSLGVNLFWKITKEASKHLSKFHQEYDVMLHEFHHRNKIDSPSGTAISTAEIVLENFSSKNTILTQTLQRKPLKSELHVSSTRGGAIPGTHSLIFDSLFDSIEITHTARSREGFALGAVLAAENIYKTSVGLHEFSAIFDEIFGH